MQCAKLIGRRYVGVGEIHMFSKQCIPYWRFRVCFKSLVRWITRNGRKSLLAEDYDKLTGEKL